MSDLLTIEQRNKRRLAKIHKLKRDNLILSDRRKSKVSEVFIKSQSSGWFVAISILTLEIAELSERIGKNGNKIQRLRTLINQDKSWLKSFYQCINSENISVS